MLIWILVSRGRGTKFCQGMKTKGTKDSIAILDRYHSCLGRPGGETWAYLTKGISETEQSSDVATSWTSIEDDLPVAGNQEVELQSTQHRISSHEYNPEACHSPEDANSRQIPQPRSSFPNSKKENLRQGQQDRMTMAKEQHSPKRMATGDSRMRARMVVVEEKERKQRGTALYGTA